MKSLAQQVQAYIDYRLQLQPGEPFGPKELAKLVATHQPPGESACKRQNIEHILGGKSVNRPRYFVSLAKAMGTTAEVLERGAFVPGEQSGDASTKGDHLHNLEDAEWMMLQHYRGMLDEDREELSAEIARRAEHVRKVVREKTKGLSVPVISQSPSPANKPKKALPAPKIKV